MDEETRKKLKEWSTSVGQGSPKTSEPAKPSFQPSPQTPPPNVTPIKEAMEKKEAEDKDLLKRIRTYESDAAEHIRNKKDSLSTIAIAEQKRKGGFPSEDEEGAGKAGRQIVYAALSLIFIAAGIGALYGWYLFSSQNKGGAHMAQGDSLVSAEEVETILFDYPDSGSIISALSALQENPPVNLGGIYEVRFVEEELDENGETTQAPISARTFFEALSVRAPISLFRSVETNFSYGIIVLDENYPFLIIETSFYQNAFASMLNWEEAILEDLPFIAREVEPRQVVIQAPTSTPETGTSTTGQATSTEEIVFVEQEVSFKDKVVSNHDTRVAQTEEGETVFLYAFPRENLLIVTSDEKAFETLLDRMNAATFSG